MSGVLALVGGAEWTEGCEFDADLLAAAGGGPVAVVATAAAYENPGKVVARARAWFDSLGAEIVEVPVYDRPAALDPAHAETVAASPFVYLSSGSAMHLRSVLLHTPLWTAIADSHEAGCVLAAAGPSAAVLCDAMVDPRGGGFGVGLGLLDHLSLIPRYDQWSRDKSRRTEQLAPKDLTLVGIPERTALIREPDGTWRSAGVGEAKILRGTL